MPTFEKARIPDAITRAEMAKMISVYATNIFGYTSNTKKFKCLLFTDRRETNTELQGYITTACQLGLMGYYANGKDIQSAFRPNDTITRAEV
jgi:hypothetical protein